MNFKGSLKLLTILTLSIVPIGKANKYNSPDKIEIKDTTNYSTKDNFDYKAEIKNLEGKINTKTISIKFLEERLSSNCSTPERKKIYNQKLNGFYKELETLNYTKDSLRKEYSRK